MAELEKLILLKVKIKLSLWGSAPPAVDTFLPLPSPSPSVKADQRSLNAAPIITRNSQRM
jgi:hypothetical protein